ncbi:Hypothetical Protein FCC1311_029162 [Hondaea fermentalgiana]|uniref:Uncharacterized protein n=1 Tax=Hondaea fermentalgiana TaxID=2315210 RepID=A0A2R5G821_9STRA|nr:Hypothetical Protein FCC1311_029162 [Hondaea fermentalgiana]|eukprot:GBG26695.1 Hypothetical Protein FCC1311_029162 [Hondaea fermentalgiana]
MLAVDRPEHGCGACSVQPQLLRDLAGVDRTGLGPGYLACTLQRAMQLTTGNKVQERRRRHPVDPVPRVGAGVGQDWQ